MKLAFALLLVSLPLFAAEPPPYLAAAPTATPFPTATPKPAPVAKAKAKLPAFTAKKRAPEIHGAAPGVVVNTKAAAPSTNEVVVIPPPPPEPVDMKVQPRNGQAYPSSDQLLLAEEAGAEVKMAPKLAPSPVQVASTPAPVEPALEEPSSLHVVIRDSAPGSVHPRAVKQVTRIRELPPLKSRSRFYLGAGYLNARYSQLESDLGNGASTLSIALGHAIRNWEGRLALEIGHGLDQSVTPQNVRNVVVRGDLSRFYRHGLLAPFVRGGIGYADINVRSYRAVTSDSMTIKEHVRTQALALFPGAGVRVLLPRGLTLEGALEYDAFLGTNRLSTLGGWAATAALGLPF